MTDFNECFDNETHTTKAHLMPKFYTKKIQLNFFVLFEAKTKSDISQTTTKFSCD